MKILVIGSNGQLGSDCMNLFRTRHTVTGRDLPDIDITIPQSVEVALHETKPDMLVNCAAFTAVDRAESEIQQCHALNALAPGILAQACAARNIMLVHISTDYVFDGVKEPPDSYSETDEPNPRSVYGQTKLEGEKAVLESGAKAAILRTAWLYGAGGGNFLKTMLRLAKTRPEQPLRVVNDQWGSPTFSERLASQILKVVESPVFPDGVFHATAEGYTTWYHLAKFFLETLAVPHNLEPCTTAEYPVPAHRPHCAILENRALKELGLNVMVEWERDVEEFAQRYRQELLAPYQA